MQTYPVEEFERAIKGDPDEAQEVKGQRGIFGWMVILAVFYWWMFGGAQ